MNADRFDFRYEILENGRKVFTSDVMRLDIPASGEYMFHIPETMELPDNGEYFVNFLFTRRQSDLWSGRGETVAWEQFLLSEGTQKPCVAASSLPRFNETDDSFVFDDGKYEMTVDKRSGMLTEYKTNGRSLLKNTGSAVLLDYRIAAGGKITVEMTVDIPEGTPDVPRIGLQMGVDKALKQIEWYGRGPHENYSDRLSSAPVGLYESTVEGWNSYYIRSQENANHCGIRWASFSDAEGGTLRIVSEDDPLPVSAWNYTQEELGRFVHDFELNPADFITLNIDCAQMGVGGDNSWGYPVMDKYLLHPGRYHYRFRMEIE